MNPELIVSNDEHRAPQQGFNLRQFHRILALTWPFRGILALGIAATVVFAFLHTLSIGGVFPVFKILLEDEGLAGWVHRTVASERVGLAFAAPEDSSARSLRVTNVDEDLQAEGLRDFDLLSDAGGRSAAELLEVLATADAGSIVAVHVAQTEVEPETTLTNLELHAGGSSWKYRLLLSVAPHVGGESAGAKLHILITILTGLVILVITANVLRFVGEVLMARAILRAMMTLRARLYERTLQLPMVYFAGQETADIVTRFVQDIQEIQRGLTTLFGKFIREPLRAIFLLGAAFAIDWRVTLVVVVVAPIAVAVFYAVGRKVKKANRKLLMGYGQMIGALTTSLQNIRVVKAYTAEGKERERLSRVDWSMFKQQVKLVELQSFISPMLETVAIIAGSLMTVWLASMVLNHKLEVSTFVTLGFLLSVLADPLRKMSDVYVRLQRSTAGAERIFQVIDSPIESPRDGVGVGLATLSVGIEFKGVSFTYPGAETPAVNDVNVLIEKGETVAIVGPNGCGKTTLVSLLPRFFDPGAGCVLFDGVDIRDATLDSLRGQISLVTQDAVVFAATPVENIAYSSQEPDTPRAKEAARRAYADEFIENLPKAWDTILGERGSTLSGGQRQRLAIARAIYRDAPVLIFDEATSQIDTESELNIQNALKEFSRGRTTLIIAHRLSTIQFAHRIIVMEAGRVIDSGNHAELYKRCPLYRTLCETQLVSGDHDRTDTKPQRTTGPN